MLRILIWNVWYRASQENIFSEIARYACDVLLLQEVLVNNESTLLPELNKVGYYDYVVECRQFGKHREASCILSRWPLRGRSVGLRRGGRPPLKGGSTSRRVYLEATIQLPQVPLTVGLAHLSYPMVSGRAAFATETERLCVELARHKNRFIFGGDLNVSPRSSRFRRIESTLRHIGPDIKEPSWTWFGKKAGRRLDYAFATSDIEVTASFGERGSSDHRPIILEVNL